MWGRQEREAVEAAGLEALVSLHDSRSGQVNVAGSVLQRFHEPNFPPPTIYFIARYCNLARECWGNHSFAWYTLM